MVWQIKLRLKRRENRNKVKVYMDLHTHTFASGHGYSTLKENIEAAQARGLSFLGLSEHAPAMPGGPHKFFFSNYKCIPRQYGDLRLVCGVEANIMDFDGTLDMEESELARMEYVIASLHITCMAPGTVAQNTRACVMAMRNPYVKILGHPDDSRFPLDYEELAAAAKAEQVALEVNNSSLHPKSARQGGPENIRKLLESCRKHQVPVLLGTDSHICYTIGHFEESLRVLEEVGFPEELVLNTNPDNMKKIINWWA